MRPQGTGLASSILVAEVRQHPEVQPGQWSGYGKLMPLPELYPQFTTGKRHAAALFDHTYHVHPDDLAVRVACLSPRGLNLLLQRWVFHSARVVVPTHDFDEVTAPVYEEADLIEDWCDIAMEAGRTVEEALHDVNAWLQEGLEAGATRQKMLEQDQLRSNVRRELRTAAETWRAPEAPVEDIA
jgi:hypothetical protein